MRAIFSAIVTTIKTHRAPRKYAEPIRMVANKVIGLTALLTAALAVVQSNVSMVPAQYRDRVTAVIVAAGGVLAVVTKVAAEVMRSKVFSPATHDQAVITARRKPDVPLAPQQPMVVSGGGGGGGAVTITKAGPV